MTKIRIGDGYKSVKTSAVLPIELGLEVVGAENSQGVLGVDDDGNLIQRDLVEDFGYTLADGSNFPSRIAAYSTLSTKDMAKMAKCQTSSFNDLDGYNKLKTATNNVIFDFDKSKVIDKAAIDASYDFGPDLHVQGSVIRVASDYDMEADTGITGGAVYYVDADVIGGLGDGSSWANAFSKFKDAQSRGDAGEIHVKGYHYKNMRSNAIPTSCKIFGYGSAAITGDQANIVLDGNGTKSGNTWTFTGVPDFFKEVYDKTIIDDGGFKEYVQLASSAAVDAQPGSFWLDWGNTTLYINTVDGNEPTAANFQMLDNIGMSTVADGRKVYFKNITLLSTIKWEPSTVAGGLEVYYENVTFYYTQVHGVKFYCINSRASNHNVDGDRVNYDRKQVATGVYVPYQAFLYNVHAGRTFTDGSGQAFTGHNDGEAVIVNSSAVYTSGQNIADTIGCKALVLGCKIANSAINVGVNIQGRMDIFLTEFESNTTDINVAAGATVNTYKCSRNGEIDAIVVAGDGTHNQLLEIPYKNI